MPTTAMMIEALVAIRKEPGGVPEEHFWQLVERFRADLVNQAYAILGNQEDAEDVAQLTLAKAFRQLHTLNDPAKLGVWLRTMNRNMGINALRARKRNKVLAVESADASLSAPETTPTGNNAESVAKTTAIEQVARAVDALPEVFREVVVLRYWEHFKNEQIAARLGIPLGTVKSRLARADGILLEKLHAIWNQE